MLVGLRRQDEEQRPATMALFDRSGDLCHTKTLAFQAL
jgi:hypothetical protein